MAATEHVRVIPELLRRNYNSIPVMHRSPTARGPTRRGSRKSRIDLCSTMNKSGLCFTTALGRLPVETYSLMGILARLATRRVDEALNSTENSDPI